MKKLFAIVSIGALAAAGSAYAALPAIPSSADLIRRGHETGLTKFDSRSAFNSAAPVTREQAAKMITSWIGSHHELNRSIDADDNAGCTFHDAASIDETLVYGVETACAYGLFKGYKGDFMPKNFITRDDVHTLMARAANKMPSSYSMHASNAPSIHGSFLTRGELLIALYYINAVVEEQIAADKADTLAAVGAELDNAKQLRDNKAIHHYTATQQLSCFCLPNSTHPVSFDVISGAVVSGSLQDVHETDKIPASQLLVEPKTVEQMFALIQDAIDREADKITVTYDETLGYPTAINIDYSVMMADEEQSYTYSVKVVN